MRMKIKKTGDLISVVSENELFQFKLGKQNNKINTDIKNKVWVYTPLKVEVPEHKRDFWMSQEYESIKELGSTKQHDPKTNLHKATWQVLFNQPNTILIYAEDMNDTLWGIVKFALQNNIQVAIELFDIPYKELIKPVTNLRENSLFLNMKVEDLAKANDPRPEVEEKLLLLRELRNQYRKPEIYPALNAATKQLRNASLKHKQARKYERYIIASRYYIRDYQVKHYKPIGLMDKGFSVYNLNLKEERRIREYLRKTISYYDGMEQLVLDEPITTIDQARRQKDYRHGVDSPSEKLTTKPKVVDHLGEGTNLPHKVSSLTQCIDAVAQLKYYRQNNIPPWISQYDGLDEGKMVLDDVLSNTNFICWNCHQKKNVLETVLENKGFTTKQIRDIIAEHGHISTVQHLRSAEKNWELYGDPKNYCNRCGIELPDPPVEVEYYGEPEELDTAGKKTTGSRMDG